jgi:hypothetical protein
MGMGKTILAVAIGVVVAGIIGGAVAWGVGKVGVKLPGLRVAA